jgi:SAM-dependent methyltransferase/uncharacterized protein YbaR (Trm112 family)
MLDILECPFCGGRLDIQPSPRPEVRAGDVLNGIIRCQCCAYPVVGGIPVIRTGPTADAAMELFGDGRAADALKHMLALSEAGRAARFDSLMSDAKGPTFRAALEVLSEDAEGVYLLYRFSDPTFLCAQAVLESVVARRPSAPAKVLDVGGGAGHLARAVGRLAPSAEVIVADVAFWKLWLAKRFVAPGCEPVCCDAAAPLPLARATVALTYCSDALHYVWPRRLLADEIMRATQADGTIVLCHLHNALCENDSSGMPLTPAGYRHLFEERQPLLNRERDVLDAVVSGRPIELGTGCSDAELADEPALVLTAGVAPRTSPGPAPRRRRASLRLNPLYAAVDGSRTVRLRFPSAFYAEEFGACRRYLPEQVELPERWVERCQHGEYDERISHLFERHVLLDLPQDYL